MSAYIACWLSISGVLAVVALIGWLACYMTALEWRPGTAVRRQEMRDARKCLAAVSLAWAWPLFILLPPVALAYGIFQTLKESS